MRTVVSGGSDKAVRVWDLNTVSHTAPPLWDLLSWHWHGFYAMFDRLCRYAYWLRIYCCCTLSGGNTCCATTLA
eukprot:1859465-Rhodomonas_salina.1